MKRALWLALLACNDVTSYTTTTDHFEGAIVQGPFVRAGMGGDVRLCLTFDGARFQEAPGVISTNDGRFQKAALRPIPQQWSDAISLMSFGDNRTKSMLYAAAPGNESDAIAVLSLMRDGSIELRLVRSAPGREGARVEDSPLYGVFHLERAPGACPF